MMTARVNDHAVKPRNTLSCHPTGKFSGRSSNVFGFHSLYNGVCVQAERLHNLSVVRFQCFKARVAEIRRT